MPLRAIQWAKQSSAGFQASADGSRLVNLYAVAAAAPESDRKTPVILYGAPGVRTYLNLPDAVDPSGGSDTAVAGAEDQGVHGMLVIESPIYGDWLVGINGRYQVFWHQLSDNYRPFDGGTPSGVAAANQAIFTREAQYRAIGRVKMVTNGRYVVWVTARQVYALDIAAIVPGGTGDRFVTLKAPIPDDNSASLPDQDWVDCDWINGYFVLLTRSGQIFHSKLNSIDFDQLEFDYADAKPDGGVGIAGYSSHFYVFGDRSVEIFYDAGREIFAFVRNKEQTIEVGCRAKDTIQVLEEGICYLGHDGTVQMLHGGTSGRVSNESVERVIRESSQRDAWAVSYTEEGHRFYVLYLPLLDGSAVAVWCFDTRTGLWHERTLNDVLCTAPYYLTQLVGRKRHKRVDAMSIDFGDHNGEAVERTAISPTLHWNQGRATLNSFLLDIPRRAPLAGSGVSRLIWGGNTQIDWGADTVVEWRGIEGVSADKVFLEYTDSVPDSGETEEYSCVGSDDGKSMDSLRYKWNRLGQLRAGRRIRVRTMGTRKVTMLGAYADYAPGTD